MAFNNEDILILAKAGFNAQQIAALNIVGQQQVTAPQPIPEVAPEPQPQPIPEPQPAPQPTSTIDDVLKSVEGLTKTFQNGFMLGATQPKPVTAEDILANIINPPQE
mgnify:CR=1 FL=1